MYDCCCCAPLLVVVAVNQDRDAQGRGVAAGRRVSGGDFANTRSGGDGGPKPPPATATLNIWARNLHDGGTALIFINTGQHAVQMQCDAECIAQAHLVPGPYKARDLYSRKALGDEGLLTVGKNGFEVGLVPGDAGSVLWKLSPATFP